MNILATELQRLRHELDQKDMRIRELESSVSSGRIKSKGGVVPSKFDYVRAGANNLRQLKAQRETKKKSSKGKGRHKNKKRSKNSSSARR